MKTIGMLGGMSWESAVPYYQTINRVVGERLGGLHSARIVLYSVDFHEVEQLQHAGRWDDAAEMLMAAARRLEGAGAECLVLCTNTMHKVAPHIEASVAIPLLHIADATATSVAAAKMDTVGLLGTRFTMEEEFYRGRLATKHGLKVLSRETWSFVRRGCGGVRRSDWDRCRGRRPFVARGQAAANRAKRGRSSVGRCVHDERKSGADHQRKAGEPQGASPICRSVGSTSATFPSCPTHSSDA